MPDTYDSSPVFDTDSHGGGAFGDLPEWDLTDLYPAPDAPEVSRDLDKLEQDCVDFAARYEGNLANLSAEEMLEAIRAYEAIDLIGGRLASFAYLRYAQKTTDPERTKFLADIQTRITDAVRPTIFWSLELNSLPEDNFASLYKASADLARYRPIFDRIRKMQPHQLSAELEQYNHDHSPVDSAWVTLFDETIAGLLFDVNGEEMGLEATLDLLTSQDRATRESGARAVAETLGRNLSLFSRIHNTLAKAGEISDRWRKFETPQSSRHLANDVEVEVVEALRNAVVAAYPRLSHRYYTLKAKWLGLERMQVWDRNAPLPMESERKIGWDEARQTVEEAYAGFDPRMAELAQPFFTDGWIDAGVKEGKAPGAFAHPTVADAHPYVMLNYLGKPRDVMTLAHELGHGVHQRLAAGQGELLSQTPLTLAETASVFGEMLTFRKLLAQAETDAERKVLLAGKVEDMINTVVRQIAFYDFECKLHAARREEGELTPDRINALWMSVQAESLGPVFDFMDGYETFWAYIPHFVHSPFYVYAYAFGDGLVNALYAAYEEQPEEFQEKYFDMLRAGGSKHHSELLAPFGLNAADPAFWMKGLSMIEGMIDELEEME